MVDLWHGPWVETREGFFCDGAWSDDFGNDRIETASLMGSGGRIDGNELIVTTPSHVMERLHVLRAGDSLFISNSIVFLLSQAGDAPHPRSLRYGLTMLGILRGIYHHPRHVPTANGRRIRFYYYRTLRIDRLLKIIEESKPIWPDFIDYADYRGFLKSQIAAIVANAADPRRRVRYEPVATMSSGYDSPACSVLAREAGARKVLTCLEGRDNGKGGGSEDSGAAIAEQLGMEVQTFNRNDYLQQPHFPEAEFFGSPSAAMFAALTPHLEGKLVFCGHYADRVWDWRLREDYHGFVRKDASGSFQEEFRLRVGWLSLFPAFLGCTSYSAINQISKSEEMQPWSVGGTYNRPIARRILETAGVQRGTFAHQKRAIDIVPEMEGGQFRWMTPESLEDFQAFVRENWTRGTRARRRVLEKVRQANLLNDRLKFSVELRLKKYLGITAKLPNVIPRDYRFGPRGNTDELALLFQWSVDKLSPRYRFEK
ncbi:MAG: hypothetical protein WDZ59_03220 [Pirellulales bacterium]